MFYCAYALFISFENGGKGKRAGGGKGKRAVGREGGEGAWWLAIAMFAGFSVIAYNL